MSAFHPSRWSDGGTKRLLARSGCCRLNARDAFAGMHHLDETELLRRCRTGDTEAWEALFTRHYTPAYRFVFQLGFQLSHEDTEEICQEAFLSVVRKLDAFQGGCAFQTWLFRIAANKARDFIEKQTAVKRGSGQTPVSLDAEDPETGTKLDPPAAGGEPDAALLDEERARAVHDAVARLEEPCREIIQLRYFGDLSYDELAGALNLHPKTVSSRLSRCLDRLEEIVRGQFAGENPAGSSV
jgi:RNA polymerase sigma-70 factor (ECF subfamily)